MGQHFSSPSAVWNEDEQLWFIYFHYYNEHYWEWQNYANPSPPTPGLGYQMTALATCPDLSSHNWTTYTNPVWHEVNDWDMVPVLPTVEEHWSREASSYHAIQRLPHPLANGHAWLGFLRGTAPDWSTGAIAAVGFASSSDGRNWTHFAENPLITRDREWTVDTTEYRPKFIGYLGKDESNEDEYLVAWAEHSNPHIIYSKTTDFKTFQRDSRGYANWGIGQGGRVSAWREGDRLYLFTGNSVHEMVLPLLDQDGDGMNDDWEEQYFGSTTNSSGGPGEDQDGDGFRDVYEFEAGTDPTNASSLLVICDASAESGAQFVVKWLSVPTKCYSIFQSPDPTGPWSLSASNLVATPPLNVHTIDVNSAREFFRIGLEN
jgi:hypothetical protein